MDISYDDRWSVDDYDPEKDSPPESHHHQDEDPPDLPPEED
jgi:hypothetical protein